MVIQRWNCAENNADGMSLFIKDENNENNGLEIVGIQKKTRS